MQASLREACSFVLLLDAPGTEEQLQGLKALATLALNGESRVQIREAEAIPKVVGLLDSSCSGVQEAAVEVLWNLASDNENRHSILTAGGVTKLLGFLPRPRSSAAGRSSSGGGGGERPTMGPVAGVLGALANLAMHPENQAVMLEQGGLQVVVDMLSSAEDPQILERCANCVESLALDRECREALRSLDTIGMLVKLLSSARSSSGPHKVPAAAAVAALKNLSVDAESWPDVERHSGLPELLGLLNEGGDIARGKAAECLAGLALDEGFRRRILDLDGVRQLISVLKGPGVAEATCVAVVGALLNLAVDDQCKLAICHCGGAPKLVQLLHPDCDPHLRAVSAMTLMNLSAQADCARAIAGAGGVGPLLQCLAMPTSDVLQEKAAGALWNVASADGLQGEIVEAGGVLQMLGMLRECTFAAAVENCLGALGCLAEDQECRLAVVRADGVSLALRLLAAFGDAGVAAGAAGLLWNLAHEAGAQEMLLPLGGLEQLTALLSHESALVRLNTVGLFPLLAEQEANVQEVFKLGALESLVELLGREESNVLAQQSAAQALGMIIEGSRERQQEFARVGGLRQLVLVMCEATRTISSCTPQPSQSAADGEQLLAKCCFAVWMACEGNDVGKVTFADAGGLTALVKVLRAGTGEAVLEMAAGAVCAVCEGSASNKKFYREEGGLEPLVALLHHGSQPVCLNAAKALCHLCQSEENRQMLEDLGGLQRLRELLDR